MVGPSSKTSSPQRSRCTGWPSRHPCAPPGNGRLAHHRPDRGDRAGIASRYGYHDTTYRSQGASDRSVRRILLLLGSAPLAEADRKARAADATQGGRSGRGNRLPTRKCEFGFWRRGLTSRYVPSTDLRAVARPSRGCPARRRRDERPASQAHDAGDGRRLRDTRYVAGAIGSATRGGANRLPTQGAPRHTPQLVVRSGSAAIRRGCDRSHRSYTPWLARIPARRT